MKKLFTKFDIWWGYNNVCIKEGDKWKAAFITNEGLYEPMVMFFSLTNSPATFQAMMNAIFEDKIREGWLTVYMDDMLIATPDNLIHCQPTLSDLVLEYGIHHSLEGGGGIGEAEEHDHRLVQPFVRDEGSFPLV